MGHLPFNLIISSDLMHSYAIIFTSINSWFQDTFFLHGCILSSNIYSCYRCKIQKRQKTGKNHCVAITLLTALCAICCINSQNVVQFNFSTTKLMSVTTHQSKSQFSRLEKLLIVSDRLSLTSHPPWLPLRNIDLYAVSSGLRGDLSNQSDGVKWWLKNVLVETFTLITKNK